MNIFLIAGHGDGDSGAIGNRYEEANLTREIVGLIPQYLDEYANVTVGDIRRDWFQWLKTNTFDFTPYDYVLELHFNSGADDEIGDGIITGSEIYVTTSEAGITVEEDILDELEKIGYTNRGVKRRNYTVIYKVKMQGVSSALLEVAFIDDFDDMRLYQSRKEETAQAIAEGIIQGFGLRAEEDQGGEENMANYEELLKRIELLESRLADAETTYNYIDDNLPEWSKATVEKLVNNGWLLGNNDGELMLSTQMLRIFVVNDRAGLYD